MFLSKEERVAEALRKRQEEVEKQKIKMEEERKARQKYVEGSENSTGHRRSANYQSEDRERRRGDTIDMKDKEKEAEAIRVRKYLLSLMFRECYPALQERYLGGEKKKKRMRRLADRKFVFDWDTTEDTSTDFNPM